MIDLKRNSKKDLVPATGVRSRRSSIYRPGQTDDFKISRGRFSNFLTCKRCFYLDRVMGLDAPGTPGWTLNETTDLLLKKEFDDGNFDKRDVNTHQAKSYLLRLQRQKETITPGTSQPEVFNVLGQLQSIERIKKDHEQIEATKQPEQLSGLGAKSE